MNKYIYLIILLLPPSIALGEQCNQNEAIEAESTAAYIKSWNKLEEHYVSFGHCDDGAIAEGYSESVSYLMENNWPEFLSYKMELPFFNFVKKHIDETWGADRLKKVAQLASNHCNKAKEAICVRIQEIDLNSPK